MKNAPLAYRAKPLTAASGGQLVHVLSGRIRQLEKALAMVKAELLRLDTLDPATENYIDLALGAKRP
jgi:hypothetical protein